MVLFNTKSNVTRGFVNTVELKKMERFVNTVGLKKSNVGFGAAGRKVIKRCINWAVFSLQVVQASFNFLSAHHIN